MIQVIDDVIPKTYQNEIENLLLGTDFPWYFTNETTLDKKHQREYEISRDYVFRPAAFHVFSSISGEKNSPVMDFIFPMIMTAADKAGCDDNIGMGLSRTFLQYPLPEKFVSGGVDPLHVDNPTNHHTVVLYYVCDADGETILYNKKYDYDNPDPSKQFIQSPDGIEEIQRVAPKKGRCIVFDGSYYHTAVQPRDGMRCVINSNIFERNAHE